jgi:5'-nucleotidase
LYVGSLPAIILHVSPAKDTLSPTVGDPLIVITNDDGITSPGLLAAVRAALPLGELLVAAPDRQWSAAGRGFSQAADGRIKRRPLEVVGTPIRAYEVGASPAATVVHTLIELVPRTPSLLISGINFGENLGSDITRSGTVGAALQAATTGVRSLAISLQTPKHTHAMHSDSVDFAAAEHFTRLFARRLLDISMPFDADILKVDVPSDATPTTPWRVARASRHTYFTQIPRGQGPPPDGATVGLDYEPTRCPELAETDSDIYALAVDRVVAVVPLSLDLTARASLADVEARLRSQLAL